MLTGLSRWVLFGGETQTDMPQLHEIFLYKMVNIGRRMIGLQPARYPGFRDFFSLLWSQIYNELAGRTPDTGAPAGVPVRMFQVIDNVLRARGGVADRTTGAFNFWLNRDRAIVNPMLWALFVEYAPTANIKTALELELALEDALAAAGLNLNVRVLPKPLRVEIDNPTVPMVNLLDLWNDVLTAIPANKRQCVIGKTWQGGNEKTMAIALDGEDFSAFIAGAPGSGKTQLSMSMLLTFCLLNDPTRFGMLIIDPKAIDFRPFNGLPHLLTPVVNEPSYAAEQIASLVAEMDNRTRQAARGDRSFLDRTILLYVDELSDLLNSLPAKQAEQAAVDLQRLAQKGRGVGFIVVAATQRVYDVPASAYSKLNARFVGKMRNAGDSVAASGIPGTQTNRLPGRGSFELYSAHHMGLRIQAPFVADASKTDYEHEIGRFVTAVCNRWRGKRADWFGGAGAGQQAAAPEQAEQQPAAPATGGLDPELFAELRRKAEAAGVDSVTSYTIRNLYENLTGKQLNSSKARAWLESFQSLYGASAD